MAYIIEVSDATYDEILEKVDLEIPKSLKEKIANTSDRRKMLEKCGSKAFLIPEKLKFPIYDPSTCEPCCKLLHAAYVRLRQYSGTIPGYRELAEKVKNIIKDESCESKLGIHLEGTDVILNIINYLDLIEK